MPRPREDRGSIVRQTLIGIAKRRQRAGSGSDLLREKKASMQWPDLTEVLRDIRWAIVGAVATRNYMRERATQDLDVVVLARDAKMARERHGRVNEWRR